ncbi:MAG TPA: biotin--[acetyl-CoA-carboxylase] ligase [Flavisolibacter sp.]|nr:biotin--[acetyl-CoA-carboxylase] ligase [Flavisolibacter sp.]
MRPPFGSIGQSFIELQEVDSTNNYATALLHEGMASHGTVVFAHRQTAGKGQRHKSWVTGSTGLNIALTAVVHPHGLAASQMFLLSMASAIAVQQFYSVYAGGKTKVKWPNDLYWNDRKAAGILIENSLSGTTWKHAIVGIGVNINQQTFPGLETSAVSLANITGEQYNVISLAKDLCKKLDDIFRLLLENPGEIVDVYQTLLYRRDEQVRLKLGSRQFEATIRGVLPSGELVAWHGVEELFTVGAVEWLVAK